MTKLFVGLSRLHGVCKKNCPSVLVLIQFSVSQKFRADQVRSKLIFWWEKIVCGSLRLTRCNSKVDMLKVMVHVTHI